MGLLNFIRKAFRQGKNTYDSERADSEVISDDKGLSKINIVSAIQFPNHTIRIKSHSIQSINTDPEDHVLCYEFGHLFRIMPEPNSEHHDIIGMIYDSVYIFSDGIPYNLSDIDSVKSIKVPSYEVHAENQKDKSLGICGCLEELLRMKYHDHIIGDTIESKELALACLEKSAQLMCFSDEKWSLESFYQVVDALQKAGKTSKAERWKLWLDKNILPKKLEEKKTQPLSFADKERILVQRMRAEDMLQFTQMPYDLNCPLHKFDKPKAHAYAYMELTPENIIVAKRELQRVNVLITNAKRLVPSISKWAHIDIDRIAFSQFSQNYGYTILVCTPYTYTGKIEKYPLQLLFMSFQPADSLGYTVNGEIKYTANGQIALVTVNCWYRRSWEKASDGWQYVFSNNNGNLEAYEILSTIRPDEYGRPTAVYKCPALIEAELQRAADYETYEWIKVHLPDLCPKSASAFRSMKTKNSKGYQKIVEAARQLGKTL